MVSVAEDQERWFRVIAIFSSCPWLFRKLYEITFHKSVCGKEEEYPGTEIQHVLTYLVQSKGFSSFFLNNDIENKWIHEKKQYPL